MDFIVNRNPVVNIVNLFVPKNELVQALSWLTIPALVAPIIGPPVGGFIATYSDWRWIFLINLPMGALGLVLAWRFVPDLREPVKPLDWTGFALSGLGLALVADFRVVAPEARFSANFNRLGFHPGFGLSVTLPRLVGPQKAALLFYTGRRIGGEEAVRIGLARPAGRQGRRRAGLQGDDQRHPVG